MEDRHFIRLFEDVYACIDCDRPVFFVRTPYTKAYKKKLRDGSVVDTYLATVKGIFAMPIDPETAAYVHHRRYEIESQGGVVSGGLELLRRLYEVELKKGDRLVRLSNPVPLAISFRTTEVASILERTFEAATYALDHFFGAVKETEKVEKYIRALAEYEKQRHSWIETVGFAVFLALMGLAIVLFLAR